MRKVVLACAAALLAACGPGPTPVRPPGPNPFWHVCGAGATGARLAELRGVLARCAAGLQRYIKAQPGSLQVVAYADRPAFVRGLQRELGYPRRLAEYFRHSSSPRPMRGKLLVPPDQNAVNVCHEVVHHVMESVIPREELLQAKWFDEGSASLLSALIIAPTSIRGQLGWFRSRHRYVPLYRMRTEQGWGELHRVPQLRGLAYLQAMDMINTLVRERGGAVLGSVARQARTRSVDRAFAMVTGRSVEAFFAGYLDRTRGSSDHGRLRDPMSAWLPSAEPEAVGLDPVAVRALVREAVRTRSDTLLVIRDGKIVVERYFFDERGPIETLSVTKSVVSMAIGKLLARRKIESLDVPIRTWFPAWRGDDRTHVTLRHVLTHTSGLAHAPADGPMMRHDDRVKYAAGQPLVSAPGTRFSYNNEAVQLLGEVVRQAAGMPLDRYAARELFHPSGIREYLWDRDPQGNVLAFRGLALSARGLARLGLTMLDGGILPTDWIRQSTGPGMPDFPQIGLLWWRRQASGSSGFNANGWQGQYLAVYPGWRLVVVRQRRPVTFTEEENRRYGMWSFFELVERLVVR